MPLVTSKSNCHSWSCQDTIVCPAERALARMNNSDSYNPEQEITIFRARNDFHSFQGNMPLDLHHGLRLTGQESAYPRSLYVHPENAAICDAHGHKCLDG